MRGFKVFAVLVAVLPVIGFAVPTWSVLCECSHSPIQSAASSGCDYSTYLCTISMQQAFDGSSVGLIEKFLRTNLSDDSFEKFSFDHAVGTGWTSADYTAIAFYGTIGFLVKCEGLLREN